MPALKDNLLKYGVLRCRELVELYFGWRMVSFIREQVLAPAASGTTYVLLQQDPRRIAYDIVFANPDNTTLLAAIGTPQGWGLGNTPLYNIPPGDTLIISRNFLTSLDSVTEEIDYQVSSTDLQVSTIETILTPAPVDEVPLA